MVDKVFPNQGSRHVGRMGEGQQEVPGREGSWAHTAQPTGQPQGPSPGSTPQGVTYPHVQPSTGPEASERLGQEARGLRGVLSYPETTPCCSALCRGPVTYMGSTGTEVHATIVAYDDNQYVGQFVAVDLPKDGLAGRT